MSDHRSPTGDQRLKEERARSGQGEPVAWTGSGSLRAIAGGLDGYMWPDKADAHPIPLYLAGRQAMTAYDERSKYKERLEEAEAEVERLRRALYTAAAAMKIASVLPGAAAEYDFEPAISAVRAALEAKP
jgi:hypothetical protein